MGYDAGAWAASITHGIRGWVYGNATWAYGMAKDNGNKFKCDNI